MFALSRIWFPQAREVLAGILARDVVLRARIRRRLGQYHVRAGWALVARVCSMIRSRSRDQRRWRARTGYALYRARRFPAAADELARAIAADESADWRRAVETVRRDDDLTVNPGWLYSLGACLRSTGELDAAATLIRAACARESSKAGWHDTLAQVEEQLGNLVAAMAALERVVELDGDENPRLLVRLATIHHQAGQWREAAQLLEQNIRRHPEHPESYRLLADASSARAAWGGTFEGALPDRLSARFAFDRPANSDTFRRAARTALEKAVRLGPLQTQWRAALADVCLVQGDLKTASEHYRTALKALETTSYRWALRDKQKWRFQLERCFHGLGKPRVEDPLFECEVRPVGAMASGVQQVPGFFDVRLNDMGLTVHGILAAATANHVEVLLNGTPLRSVNLSSDGHLPRFTLLIKRRTIALLPHRSQLEVRIPEGPQLLGPAGSRRIEVVVPRGDGKLLKIINDGGQLNKKGEIGPTPAQVKQRQDQDLEVYSAAREFFERELGRPLFLLYGTLLGYYRDGDFIQGDDDFDAGYVSDKTDPVGSKNEAKEIIVELIRSGFTVSFNRRGRLFRVQLDDDIEGCHVDVHHVWFQHGSLWAHNHLCMPGTREDFLPVANGKLRGSDVSVPHRPEAFLRGNYGPGWTVPDSGFRYYPSQVHPDVRRNLNKALLTSGEYRELENRVRRETARLPGAGKLVSLGSQDLYPL